MADALLLTNPVRHYAWGSRTVLPELLGEPAPSAEPWAEIWIGAHPLDASTLPDGRSLAAVEPELPFLVKLLAAEVPLSIQAHPSPAQAVAGFEREEAAGVSRTGAERTYKDTHHKPELLVALTRTEALCGFRSPAEILALAEGLGAPEFSRLVAGLARGAVLRDVFGALLTLAEPRRDVLLAQVRVAAERLAAAAPSDAAAAAAWVPRLMDLHPGDASTLAPLLLRLIELVPGDGIFVASGVLHAYLHGAGVEVQASSDNVLRGGLTGKPVDIADLLSVMSDDHGPAPLVHPRAVGPGLDAYDVPVRDFAVWRARPDGRPVTIEATGPRVVVCVSGEVAVCGTALRPGLAVYVPTEVPTVVVDGSGTTFVTAPG